MSLASFVDESILYLFGLPSLSFTEYETRVYLALLMAGEKTPTEVSRIAKVPRARTYATLESLVARDFVEKTGEKPLRYRTRAGSYEKILRAVQNTSKQFEGKLSEILQVGKAGIGVSIPLAIEKICVKLCYMITSRKASTDPDTEFDLSASTPNGFNTCFEIKTRIDLISESQIEKMINQSESLPRRCDFLVLVSEGEASDDVKSLLERRGIIYCPFGQDFDSRLADLLIRHEKIRLETTSELANTRDWLLSQREKSAELDHLLHDAIREYNDSRQHFRETKDLQNLLDSVMKYSEQSTFIAHDMEYQIQNLDRIMNGPRLGGDELHSLRRIRNEKDENLALLHQFEDKLRLFLHQISEMKAKRDVWFQYMLKENPFAISAPEKPDVLIDQDQVKNEFEKVLRLSNHTRSSIAVILTGDYGSGKTHFMNYYVDKINEKMFGNNVAIYTAAKRELTETFAEFLLQSKTVLGTSWLQLREQWMETEPANDFYSILERLRRFSSFIEKQGVGQVFWFIDELERISSSQEDDKGLEADSHSFMHQLRTLIDEAQKLHLSLIISCSTPQWADFATRYPFISARIRRILQLKPFQSKEQVKAFLDHLVERTRIGKGGLRLPEFSDEALQSILQKANGNPRRIIIECREAFWEAIDKKSGIIDSSSLDI